MGGVLGIRLYQTQHELEVVLAEQMPPLKICAHTATLTIVHRPIIRPHNAHIEEPDMLQSQRSGVLNRMHSAS